MQIQVAAQVGGTRCRDAAAIVLEVAASGASRTRPCARARWIRDAAIADSTALKEGVAKLAQLYSEEPRDRKTVPLRRASGAENGTVTAQMDEGSGGNRK